HPKKAPKAGGNSAARKTETLDVGQPHQPFWVCMSNETTLIALRDCIRADGSAAGKKRRAKPAGFTLIELLVVLAVIAVLTSLLLPTLGRAAARARTTRCCSNLRQVSLSLALYLQDHGEFPLATSGGGMGAWQRALRDTAGPDVFFCPQRVKT